MKLGNGNHTVRFIGLVSVVCLAMACAAFGQESGAIKKRFTNEDVISMAQLGLTDDVIIAKIRAMSAAGDAISFDTGVEGLKKLKAGGVPDSVIKAMINPTCGGADGGCGVGGDADDGRSEFAAAGSWSVLEGSSQLCFVAGASVDEHEGGRESREPVHEWDEESALGCHARRADFEERRERTAPVVLFVCAGWIRCGGLRVDQAEQEERSQGISGGVVRRNYRREVGREEGQGTWVQGGSRWDSNVQGDVGRGFEARRVCVFYGDWAGGDDVGGARGESVGGQCGGANL